MQRLWSATYLHSSTPMPSQCPVQRNTDLICLAIQRMNVTKTIFRTWTMNTLVWYRKGMHLVGQKVPQFHTWSKHQVLTVLTGGMHNDLRLSPAFVWTVLLHLTVDKRSNLLLCCYSLACTPNPAATLQAFHAEYYLLLSDWLELLGWLTT